MTGSKLCYGIKETMLDGITPLKHYWYDGALLARILKKIQELRLEYYVDAKGEPVVKWQGKWTGYKAVAMNDNKLLVEGL